ncbi:uncharacterized protein, partial [Ptychodera flava]|uniref:uncharacterized protein n=1 Tax=Ptychodera flava TaxID=63121 RepID=UPI003969EACA
MATPSTTILLYTAVFDVFTTVAPTQSTSSSCRDVEGATRCANFRGEGYCFQQWSSLNQRCVDGICECNNPNYDRCTCLPKVDGCVIAIDDDDAAATYSFRGGASSGGYKVYSCRDENPSNEVHVIGNYEGNGHTGFRIHNTGTTQFNIQGRGNGNPIILVLNSYEPVNWVLNFSDNDVVISKVVLISYYLDKSDVTYQEGRVQSIERLREAPRGYGTGSGTVELLNYVNQRFGPVTSFTGTYQADHWDLTLET